MPLQKEDAERALHLFWEFFDSSNADDLQAYKEAISSLQVYLTDVLPASLPCLIAKGADGLIVEIQPNQNARPQVIELYCSLGEKLGLVLDKVNLNGRWLGAGDRISPIMISLITPGSAAAKDGRLARGDQLLEIDGHPLSQCSLERARWLLDRAERFRFTRLTVLTSGLTEGLKHSVSRDFLNTLKAVRPRKSKSMESMSRIHQAEIVVTAEVHDRDAKPPLKHPRPHRPKRQSSAVSSHSSSFRNHPAYAPSIGSRRDSSVSLVSSTVETAAYLARTSFRRTEAPGGGAGFKKRRVRKMHIMKGESGLGLRIVGGKGSKFGDMGIFVNKLEEGGAAFKDNRLHPGDELLMVNGKSLVGLTHNEAVDVLKSTQKLVQLVVATESTEGDSVASSLQSIPEAVAARRAYYNPPVRSSLSPLSVDSSSSSPPVGPELQQLPQRNTFLKDGGSAGLELQLKVDPSLQPAATEGIEAETKFSSTATGQTDEPTSPMEMSDQFEVVRTVTPWARSINHKAPPLPEPEVKTIVYVKTEGKSLGFSICGGKGSKRGDLGILVRNIDPDGLAAIDGRLNRGDELLDVNGKTLQGCTHKKAAGIIRSMKSGVVTLTVRSGNGKLPQGSTIKRSSSERGSKFKVTLIKAAGKPLGLQLTDVKKDALHNVVLIKNIARNSPADKCPDLKCNDQIVAVNGTSMANMRTDKVRAFLSSLPPGQIKLTLARSDKVLGSQDSRDRSMAVGQRSTSEMATTTSTTQTANLSQATPVSAEEVRGFSSESETDSEDEDSAPACPLAPPPGVVANGEMDVDSDIDELGTDFPIVIQQRTRSNSVLMNIDGSLPVFDHEGEDIERFDVGLKLPPPPPSPPASLNSDSDNDLPTIPSTAPPPIPDSSSFPLTEEDDEYPPSLPPSQTQEDRGHQREQPALPMDIPPHIPDDPTTDLPPAPPTTIPPLISNDTTLDSTDDHLPPLIPAGISESSSASYSPDISTPKDTHSAPHGFIQLDIGVKKRANSELGVTVVSSEPPTGDLFMIRRIKIAGAAYKDGRLKPGDRLVAVNGKSLAGLSHAVVLQELNNAPKDCHLVIWRDPSFDGVVATPSFSGSRTSLVTISDEEEDKPRRKSLSNQSLENSRLAMARKRSAGKGINPRDSPLVYRLSAPLMNESPLSKRWSAEDVPVVGPAGEPLNWSHDTGSPRNASPSKSSPERSRWQEDDMVLSGSPPTSTPPLPPGTPPTSTPPLPPGTPPTSTPPLPPVTPPSSTPPLPPGTPPTSTFPLVPGTPTSTPPGTPPPHIPSAPPPTLNRGMRPVYEEDISDDEAPPSPPQTPPPPTRETDEAPPPLPQTTPLSTSAEGKEAPPTLPKTTPQTSHHVTSGYKEEPQVLVVERPKSLGPVPKGKRLEDAPFEIEVTRGLLGGLGMTVCENELGMIAVKALTNRSPIAKDGNIRIGDHLISVNDESLLGKRAAEADAIIKALPRGPVRIVAMPPPRDVTGKTNREDATPSNENLKSTPSTSTAPLNSKPLLSSLSEVRSVSPSGRQMVDEEGIVRVLLHRYGGRPLGLTIEGGSDTPLKYVYIQSLSIGSPASNCGLLSRGDQIVMLGEECLIGKTHQEAKKLIDSAPDSVEIVAQRKQSPKQVMKSSIPENRTVKAGGSHSSSESDLPTIVDGSSSVRVVVIQPEGEVLPLDHDTEPPPLNVVTVPEERLTVSLHKTSNERLGLSVIGGTDNPSLPDVHVKKVLPDSVAGRNGQLKRGDRIVSVNGHSLEGVSHKQATELLRNAGDHVTFVVARKLGRRVSTAVTPHESRLASRQGSGENTQQGSKRSSPQVPKRLVKAASSSGENSRGESRGQTPPSSVRRHNRRQSLGHSGEVLAFSKGSTLPRKVGSKVGVRLVELHKGPTGLGMQIQGGRDRSSPITVKMVISGGAAHKSGKIHPGDVILEANSISFENLTHAEAMKTLKGFPQGQVSLIIRDRTAVAHNTRT